MNWVLLLAFRSKLSKHSPDSNAGIIILEVSVDAGQLLNPIGLAFLFKIFIFKIATPASLHLLAQPQNYSVCCHCWRSCSNILDTVFVWHVQEHRAQTQTSRKFHLRLYCLVFTRQLQISGSRVIMSNLFMLTSLKATSLLMCLSGESMAPVAQGTFQLSVYWSNT